MFHSPIQHLELTVKVWVLADAFVETGVTEVTEHRNVVVSSGRIRLPVIQLECVSPRSSVAGKKMNTFIN